MAVGVFCGKVPYALFLKMAKEPEISLVKGPISGSETGLHTVQNPCEPLSSKITPC